MANDDNSVSFDITMTDSYFFRPTKISFYACKCGTDGGKLDVFWKNTNGKTVIEQGISPERNNNYTAYSKALTDIASASGTNNLILHILSLGTGKALAIGNVSITGEVKSETNGISNIKVVTLGNKKLYNLQGIEVSAPTKGIYIKNGKKIIIR